MDREQAIAQLRALGHHAQARDWDMGATILVHVGELQTDGPIPYYRHAVYLRPSVGGAWEFHDHEYTPGNGELTTFADLESAVLATHAYITRKLVEWSKDDSE